MAFFFNQRQRLLRESWTADNLAEEIFAMMQPDVVMETHGQVRIGGTLTISNYTDGKPIFNFSGVTVSIVGGVWVFRDINGNIISPPANTASGGVVATITLTGDVTGSGTSSIVTTLSSVIGSGGPIGSTTVTPVITWDAKGRLLSVSSATINQSRTYTGDATGSGTSPTTLTLASIITAGGPTGSSSVTPIITWDDKGRLTAVSSATITPAGIGGASLSAANTFTVGPQTIQTGGSGNKALILKGTAGQSVNFFEIQDNNGVFLAGFNSAGRFGVGALDNTYGFDVNSGVTHERIKIVGGTSSGFYLSNPGQTDGATVRYDSTDGYTHYVSNSLECMQFTITNALCGLGNAVNSLGGAPTAQLHVWGNASGNVVAKFQGASGQSVDLVDFVNNAGTTLSSVLKTGDITTQSAGVGFQIKEGSNAKMGTGTLSGGTVVISTTAALTNSRIFLQDTSSGIVNVGALTVSSISNGVSFTVKSTNVADTGTFNWIIFDPA